MTLYIFIVCQLVIGITLQPYLIYKLKGNLKIFTIVEYTSLLGRTVTEFCTFKFITASYLELGFHDIFIEGMDYVNYLRTVATVTKHCSYLRKCVLTLTVSDFNQLILNPIQFAEFMRLRNQIVRYSLFFAFSIFVLCPEYFQIAAIAVFNDHTSLYHHLRSHKLTYDIVSSLAFHIIILAKGLECLTKMRKTYIMKKANSDSNKAKIGPLLFATTTFMVIIIISFIIELLTFPCPSFVLTMNPSCLIIHWTSFGYEGFSGFVVMILLLVWFPRLRPTLA